MPGRRRQLETGDFTGRSAGGHPTGADPRSPHFRTLVLMVPLFVNACQQQRDAERAPTHEIAPAAVSRTSAVLVHDGSTLVFDAGVSRDGGSTPDVATSRAPAAAFGDWIETSLYRFRLAQFRRCDVDRGGAAGAAGVADAQSVHRDEGPRPAAAASLRSTWLGTYVEITAKKNESFLSPRDLTLRRGGIILDARFHEHPDFPACAPLFIQNLTGAGDTRGGFVLFEIPPSFRNARAPTQLTYRPTRWGGAPAVSVGIPDCLDACPLGSPSSRTVQSTVHPGVGAKKGHPRIHRVTTD